MKINIQLPVSVFREGKHFIAYTPVLDLSASGRDYAHVVRRFHEVVGIFFEEILKKGTVREVLGGFGWQKTKNQWKPPTFIAHESRQFDIAVR